MQPSNVLCMYVCMYIRKNNSFSIYNKYGTCKVYIIIRNFYQGIALCITSIFFQVLFVSICCQGSLLFSNFTLVR